MPFCLLPAAVMTDTKLRYIFINIIDLCCHTLCLAKKKLLFYLFQSSYCYNCMFRMNIQSRSGSIQSIQKMRVSGECIK